MADVLFAWPSAAAFGRRVPKEKIYAHGTVSSALREQFVSEVASIEWAFKLAPSTINLPGSDDVPEVQVFRIAAKEEDVADSILAAIDRAVAFPTVFEIARANATVRMSVSVQKTGSYHSTSWLPLNTSREPLPIAITLPALYVALVQRLIPIAVTARENTADVAERLQAFTQLEREIGAMKKRLRNEPQLNRKLEIRRSLTAMQAELEQRK